MNELVEMRIATMIERGEYPVPWLMAQAKKKREIAAIYLSAAKAYEARAYAEDFKNGDIGVGELMVEE